MDETSKSDGRTQPESQRVGIGSNTMLCPEPNPRQQTVARNEHRSAVDGTLTHLDLFSGIGGFALASQWAGFRTVAFCEIEPFAQKVLRKHWPAVPICEDIRKLNGNDYGTIKLITGGYPCQPFSSAGKRKGAGDDRHLWPEMRRIIAEARPRWVLAENVAGHVSMGLDCVLADLESIGYSATSTIIPDCAVNASHLCDRVWIVGHADSQRREGQCLPIQPGRPYEAGPEADGASEALSDTEGEQTSREGSSGLIPEPAQHCRWAGEPEVGRVAHGLPRQLDRLRGLGNAIVPQVAFQIIKRIVQIETAQAGRVGSAERRADEQAASIHGGASGHNDKVSDPATR